MNKIIMGILKILEVNLLNSLRIKILISVTIIAMLMQKSLMEKLIGNFIKMRGRVKNAAHKLKSKIRCRIIIRQFVLLYIMQ